MTAHELQIFLYKVPPDAEIWFDDGYGEFLKPIHSVFHPDPSEPDHVDCNGDQVPVRDIVLH